MQSQVDEFLNHLEADEERSPNTTAAYRNDLNQFTKYVKERCAGVKPPALSWQAVDSELVEAYLVWLKQGNYASATVARKVAAIKSFFHWLQGVGTLTSNPAQGLVAPRVKRVTPRPIRAQEIERLLAAPAGEHTPKAVRDYALLQTLYASGMRVTELVSLDLGDVDLQTGDVACGAPGKNRRRVALSPQAVAALANYLDSARARLQPLPGETALFLNHRGQRLTRQGLWLIIRHYVNVVGIDAPVTPHTLRQSFAAHQLNAGVDLRDVRAMLGHSSAQTTQAYRRAADELAGQEATILVDGKPYAASE
jgi:integrase/recombinase XerD